MVYCNVKTDLLSNLDIIREFYRQNQEIPDLKEALFIRKNKRGETSYNLFILQEEEEGLAIEGFQFVEFLNLQDRTRLESLASTNFDQEIPPVEVRIIKMNHNSNDLSVYIKPYSD